MESPDRSAEPLFNRGDRVELDLSALAEPPDEAAPAKVREAHTRMMQVHGTLGTVIRGDDTRTAVERLLHRLTSRPAATVRVRWDGQAVDARPSRRRRRDRPYLTPVVYRSQLRHIDRPAPEADAPSVAE